MDEIDREIIEVMNQKPHPHLGFLAELCGISRQELIDRCNELKRSGKIPENFISFQPNS